MKTNHKSLSWAIISVFMLLVFAISISAQKPGPCDADPTAFPFDFNNTYYAENGVISKAIEGRRTGQDDLSIWTLTCDPRFAPVRVLVTVPGYDQFGQPLFWSPLGDVDLYGFTPDKRGIFARQMAQQFPVYIFPDNQYSWNFSAFMHGRQAPVFFNGRYVGWNAMNPNPLNLRVALIVKYTEKAFSKEGVKIMSFFADKNGLATDDTPILKSVDDISFMLANGFITAEPWSQGEGMSKEIFTIAPTIASKNGVAPDAFVWMAMKDGKPLPAEEMFWVHFDCLKKTGEMCKSLD